MFHFYMVVSDTIPSPLGFHLGRHKPGAGCLVLHYMVVDGDVHMVEYVECVFLVKLRLETETARKKERERKREMHCICKN